MSTNRDKLSKWWRPVGFWGLTINIIFGFPGIVIGAIMKPEAPWASVVGAFTSILLAWTAAAGIRQWGKSNGSEKDHGLQTGNAQQEGTEGGTPPDGEGGKPSD